MPHSYRKKPVVIEAAKFKGDENATKIKDWVNDNGGTCQLVNTGDGYPILLIDTLEGTMRAEPGDYVICGIKGEFYPCKPDIFHDSYDRIEP